MISTVAPLARRVGSLARDLVGSVWRDFLVDAFEDGRIRTRGLPAGVRVGLAIAIAVTCAMFASAAVADAWRSLDLEVLSGRQALRGTLLPVPLIPVTFAILALATALCVAGALRSGPWVSAAVGAVFAMEAAFVHGLTVGGDDLLHRAAGLAIPTVLLSLVVIRHLPPRPTTELVVILGLVGLVFADAHRLNAAADRASGTDFLASQAEVLLFDISFLSIPLVMVAALEVVAFGVVAARWGVGFVDARLGGGAVTAALVVLLAWRTRDLVLEVRGEVVNDGWVAQLRPLAASILLLAMVVAAALGVRRVAGRGAPASDPVELTEDGTAVALPVAVFLTLGLTVVAVLFLMTKVGFAHLSVDAAEPLARALDQVIERSTTILRSTWWSLLTVGVAAGTAWLLARRGRPSLAVFLATIGIVLLHATFVEPGAAAEAWAWTLSGVDLVVVGALGAAVVRWWRTGRLTPRRRRWALYLVVLTGLLRQQQFLSDPLAPFLAFNQSAFVLFGLLWGFATGLSWANGSSRSLPRASRAQLLIGYQLLSIAILHWYLVSHEMGMLDTLTRLQPGYGEATLGQPLVLVLIVTAGAALLADEDLRTGGDEARSDEEGAPTPAPG